MESRKRLLYPRAIRDVRPGPGFTRIEHPRLDGLPDGVHTGGAWLSPDGFSVWKPLDGGNGHDGDHESTLEAECLGAMAGQPGFPNNWSLAGFGDLITPGPLSFPESWTNCQDAGVPVETPAGPRVRYIRRWLVRPLCAVLGTDVTMVDITDKMAFARDVERFLRALNAQGWELGDHLSLAFDRERGEWFVLDLSCAAPTYALSSAWDDEWRFHAWLREVGLDGLAAFQEAGHHVVSDLGLRADHEIPRDWHWVYASRNRPLSKTWCRIDDAVLVPADYQGVHTWAVCPAALPTETVFQYELTLAWHRWETPAKLAKNG